MKTIQEVKSEFERTFQEVSAIQGLSATDRIQVAIAVLQEYGRYSRGEAANTARANGNSNNNDKPASPKQIKFLQDLGILVEPGITSKKASELIEANKGKGRASAPSPSFPK